MANRKQIPKTSIIPETYPNPETDPLAHNAPEKAMIGKWIA
jgi:hypothetical protein